MFQVNRLFEMIYLLLDRKKMTAKELADRFEVSVRTIYRDVEMLSSIGIPIYMTKGKGGGISLLDNFILNKTVLTEEDKKQILSSMRALSQVDATASETALQKLDSFFGGNQEDWIEVDFSTWNGESQQNELFEQLKSAILSKDIVKFFYINGKGEESERIVEPLRLCFKGSARYLYGYCRAKEDFRFFKLSRIKKLAVSEEKFTRNIEGSVLHEQVKYSKKMTTVKLLFEKKMGYRVFDEFEQYEVQKDGRVLVAFECPDENWILSYVLSFGSCCEVIEPESLRQQIREELQRMNQKYENYPANKF